MKIYRIVCVGLLLFVLLIYIFLFAFEGSEKVENETTMEYNINEKIITVTDIYWDSSGHGTKISNKENKHAEISIEYYDENGIRSCVQVWPKNYHIDKIKVGNEIRIISSNNVINAYPLNDISQN